MKRVIGIMLCLIVCFVALTTAQDPTKEAILGRWEGTLILFNGIDIKLNYEFLQDGGDLVLKGTLQNPRKSTSVGVKSVGDIKIAGKNIEFRVKHSGGEADATIAVYRLVLLDENTIKGSVQNEDLDRLIPSIVLKRVKS